MLSLRIAIRFLKKSTAQTILIIIGISVGISVVIFIGSLISSLQNFLIEQTLGSSPQITITSSKEGDPIAFSKKLETKLSNDSRVTAIVPIRVASVIYKDGSQSSPLTIKSGKPKEMDTLYKLSNRLDKGSFKLSGNNILIGKELAEEADITIGQKIELTLASGKNRKQTVTGIFDLGARELNEGLGFSGESFGLEALELDKNKYTSIELQLADVFESTKVARGLRKSFSDIDVVDWQVEREDLLSALAAQTSSTIMIQVFVIIAVALGIASTLSISAIQKTRQIGILKALGMTDGRSGTIFLWEGLILGLFGTAGGLVLGLALIRLFQYIAGRTSTDLFPIQAQPTIILVAAATGLGVAMASAILPSRRTAKLDPIEVIQGG